ncbi:MAG: radical SAM protein [Thermodesulfobacteriota bacterium]
MRVLLINTNLKGDLFAAPPIGVCYVASAAQAAGHAVTVLDLCFQRDVAGAIERSIRHSSPDVVGLSVRNIDNVNLLYPVSYLPDASRIARTVRELTSVPMVVGGAGASLDPEGVLRLLEPDYIVVSDGEEAFVKLLHALEFGGTPEAIPGVGMLRDGRFVSTPPGPADFRSIRPDLGRWIDMRPYRKMGSSYNVQTKRGCPHRCIYCTYNQVLEGSRLRLRPPGEVVDEIEEAVSKFGADTFEFVDSVFNDPRDHCLQILEEIARRPWKARFTAMGVSPRGLDRSFLALMERAGFSSFWITPESASETMIRNYRKGFTVEDVIRAAEAIQETRFATLWSFLIGGPGETNETLQESIDFALKYLRRRRHPPFSLANYYLGIRLYPGTSLWETARAEGFVDGQANPLDQLWYLSEGLDLDLAVRQIVDASHQCPEIWTGFDEQYMSFSRIVAGCLELFRRPKPYWPVVLRTNQLFLKLGLHHFIGPPNIVPGIRQRLESQGYRGPLLEG